MKPKKKLSELQRANLLTGQLLRRCSCTSELINFLRDNGHEFLASQVDEALYTGRALAYQLGRRAVKEAKESRNV